MTDITVKNFANGLNQQAASTNIPDGFVEELLNVDTVASGQLKSRKGYERYYGGLPIRVEQLTIVADGPDAIMKFKLAAAINILNTNPSPIIVGGRLGTLTQQGAGAVYPPITATTSSYELGVDADAAMYFSTYKFDAAVPLEAGSNTLVLSESDHGLDTQYIFAGIVKADNLPSQDNTVLMPGSIEIDSSNEVSIDYVSAAPEQAYIYFLDKRASAGATYISSVSAVTTATITAVSHALATANIYARCFDTTTSTLVQVEPATMTLSPSGDVTLTFATAFTGDIVLTCVPVENVHNEAAAPGPSTITIPNPGSPYNFVTCYYFNGTNYIQIWPSSISYDVSSDEISIDVLIGAGAETIEVYWENATVVSSTLVVNIDPLSNLAVFATSDGYIDNTPQLNIWGIPHAGLYAEDTRGGYVTHIDHYKRTAESRVVAGLGGVIHGAYSLEEKGGTYLMPTLQVGLRGRIDDDYVLAPAFSAVASSRTRGAVVDTGVVGGEARVVGATQVGGYIQYEIALEGNTGDTLASCIQASIDRLTVRGMPFNFLNGEFVIRSVVSETTTSIVVEVELATDKTRYNCSNTKGWAGVFTDTFETLASTHFLPGDTVVYSGSSLALEVVHSDSEALYVNGVTGTVGISSGLRVGATRTSNTFPVADLVGVGSVDNLVVGDSLTITGLERNPTITYINTLDSIEDCVVVGDGELATIDLGTAHDLIPGAKVVLTGPVLQGEYTIVASNGDEIVVESAYTGTSTVNIAGPTITLDETLSLSDRALDADRLAIKGRWIPIEASYEPFANTGWSGGTISYFPSNTYIDQPYIKSTSVQDTLLLTNGEDEVQKFDGTNLMPAGLPRWDSWMFSKVDTTTASIAASSVVAAYNSSVGNIFKFTTSPADAGIFKVGQRIEDADDNGRYVVVEVNSDLGTVEVDRTITGAGTGDDLTKIDSYTCYFRLNWIDKNNNIIASAPLGNDRCVVDLGASGTIVHKIATVPPFKNYEYSRLEIEYYRTKANQAAPFYRVQTIAVPKSHWRPYLIIKDGTPDFTLNDADFDSTQSRLLGELGTTWEPPPKASVITTSEGRAILCNIAGYPEFTIDMYKKPQSLTVGVGDLHGKVVAFRKDSQSTVGSTQNSNGVSRMDYKFINPATEAPITIDPTAKITFNSGGGIESVDIDIGSVSVTKGQWVYLYHGAANATADLTLSGWYRVLEAPSATEIRLYAAHGRANGSNGTANDINRVMIAQASPLYTVPVVLGADYNWGHREGNPSGSVEKYAMERLATAINASMAALNTSTVQDIDYAISIAVEGMFNTTPWLLATSEGLGRIRVVNPISSSLVPEIIVPTLSGSEPYEIYVHGLRRSSAQEVSARIFRGPSRAVISPPNQVEVFDAPYEDARFSASAVDINAADGQEIVAAATFFGESTFGGAQLNSIVAVFKQNSVYVLDPVSKQYQKVETRGLGCTFPRSVTSTKDGIMFANESGLYRLNRDLTITHIGQALGRLWNDRGDPNEAAGHNYTTGRKYKLSLSTGKVLVSDHDSEIGAWSTYDNHPTTGWTNLNENSFFATKYGNVMQVRNRNEASDYRDDSAAINCSVKFRAEDFGFPGIRKAITNIIMDLAPTTALTNVSVKSRVDLNSGFESAGSVACNSAQHMTARLSLPEKRGNFVQLLVESSTKDEGFELTGLHYRLSALSSKGMKENVDFVKS